MTTVVVGDIAEAQLLEIDEWWAVPLPTSSGVRRLVMRKTKHLIYYIHDQARAVVYIITVWGTPRGGDPVLRDPR